MSKSNVKKSTRFIALLPDIYYKIVVSGWGYRECAEWLLTEHNLNMFASDGKTPALFGTYLNLYGDINKAKEEYNQHLQETQVPWWERVNDNSGVKNNETKIQAKEVMETTNTSSIKNATPPASEFGSLAKILNLDEKKTAVIDDPMAGYDPMRLNKRKNTDD